MKILRILIEFLQKLDNRPQKSVDINDICSGDEHENMYNKDISVSSRKI